MKLVGLYPLTSDDARLEALLDELHELTREERADAGNPGVGGLAHDHVVAAFREQKVVAAVVHDEMVAGIVETTSVVQVEEPSRVFHAGDDLQRLYTLERMCEQGPNRDTARQP